MAKPTPLTCRQLSPFCRRYSLIDDTQPATTALGPFRAFVGRCNSLVETVRPSSQTAPIFDVVAPLSVPIKTFRPFLMTGLREGRLKWFLMIRLVVIDEPLGKLG